jgi:hypothetical protein
LHFLPTRLSDAQNLPSRNSWLLDLGRCWRSSSRSNGVLNLLIEDAAQDCPLMAPVNVV